MKFIFKPEEEGNNYVILGESRLLTLTFQSLTALSSCLVFGVHFNCPFWAVYLGDAVAGGLK